MPAQSVHAFAEKVALVTDGASSVGRAVALQLALQGSYVIIGYNNTDQATRRAVVELQSLGTLAHAVEADYSTASGAQKLIEDVEKIFGRLDLLVNTARYEPTVSFNETTETIWTQASILNLQTTFFITQAAARLMKARPKPVIVNLSSAIDTDEAARNVALASFQAGISGMTKALAAELAPKFRVNCVAISQKKKNTLESLDLELFTRKTTVADDDVARVILYLLSPEAVGISGQIITCG